MDQLDTSSWIEELALQEINMEESGIIDFNNHLNPDYLLEESSVKFMERLREAFEIYAHKFNELRGGIDNSAQIKIFKISNTVNDFMLFRNSLKLVVARETPSLITIGFMSNTGGVFSARVNSSLSAESNAHEIKAHVGPFNKITWRFSGELVEVDSLVRHYLTEFVKHFAR